MVLAVKSLRDNMMEVVEGEDKTINVRVFDDMVVVDNKVIFDEEEVGYWRKEFRRVKEKAIDTLRDIMRRKGDFVIEKTGYKKLEVGNVEIEYDVRWLCGHNEEVCCDCTQGCEDYFKGIYKLYVNGIEITREECKEVFEWLEDILNRAGWL